MDALGRDLAYSVRMLRKTPGFTVVALITLALGIGINTAVFSIVDALLLKPLPYPEADRLGTLETTTRSAQGSGSSDGSLDGATFLALRENAQTLDVAAQGSGGWGGGVNLVGEGHAANVIQSRVSAGYFKVLGVAPTVGREFDANEDRAGGPAVAILSYDLWLRLFQGDANSIGRSILLKGEPSTIVGVMPRGFTTGSPVDVWTPLRPSRSGEGGGINYWMIARLRTGVRWEEASAEIARIASPVISQQYRKGANVVCSLVPLQQGETAGVRQPVLLLWGAVALVLLIACVNIAGLLIARSAARAHETATRLALGAPRGRIVRQLLTESVLLALAGGALGVGTGWLVLSALQRLGERVLSFGRPVTLDARVLLVTVVMTLATSVLFGLLPALHASRVDVQSALVASGTRSVAGARGRWLRRILVTGEVALGIVLLVSAGLLVRTFLELKGLSPGFDPSNVVTATVSLQDARYEDPAKVARLFDETLSRIRDYPGVQAAGITLGLPYTRLLNLGFRQPDSNDPQRTNIVNLSYVTEGYMEALRIPVRAGRSISHTDAAGAPLVVVVNEEFSRRYYKDEFPMGRRIAVAGGTREIIGIVGNVRATSSGFAGYADPLVTPPIVYVPAAQTSGGFLKLVHTWFSPSWVVRGTGPVVDLSRAVREAVAAVDPMLPISRIETMTAVQASSLSPQRLMMSLVLGLGAVALLLAAVGIHGLIASSVTERRRELGIRLALGASSGRVVRDVVLSGLALAAIGAAIGAAITFVVVRLLRSFLWGVKPTDLLTFGSVIVMLLVVALLASVIPALRVLRLDPVQTLRAE